MIIAIDFDGTIVEQDKPYDQVDSEFRFVAGAEEALRALHRAGHTLLLWSARASLALRQNWQLNPIWRADPDSSVAARAEASYELNERRYQEMLDFVQNHLSGLFAAIDDGTGGKPLVDLFVDDKAVQLGGAGVSWPELRHTHGELDDDLTGTD